MMNKINYIRKSLILLFLSCSISSLFAQTDVKLKINEIKRSGNFISAEATDTILTNAEQMAEALLLQEATDYFAQIGKEADKAILANVTTLKQDLSMMRGRYHRVFMYIAKTDVLALPDDAKLVELPKSTTVVATVQPVKQTKVEILNEIFSTTTFAQLKPIFARLKQEDRLEYNVFRGESDIIGDFYLLFYDKDANIKAFLSHNNGKYVDAKSQKQVLLSSFSGLGAYWFKIK